MTRNKLPLDPFDPATPLSRNYQTGALAWSALLAGKALGVWLAVMATSIAGWIRAFGAVVLIGASIWMALRLWHRL